MAENKYEFAPLKCGPGCLFTHPVFWTVDGISKFYKDIDDFIDNYPDKNSIEFTSFLDRLNEDAKPQKIFEDHDAWSSRLPETHCQVLKTKYFSNGRKHTLKYEGDKITELVRLIRNKYVHFSEIFEEDKKVIGWNDSSKTDNEICASYWTTWFPKLLPFLWRKFVVHKNALSSIYSNELKTPAVNSSLTPSATIELLQRDLDSDLMNGGLLERFKTANRTLEFRPMDTNELRDVLPSAVNMIAVKIAQECIEIIHYPTNSGTQKYKIDGSNQSNIVGTTTVVCLKSALKVAKNILKQNAGKLFIIFTETLTLSEKLGFATEVDSSFQRIPITIEDLNYQTVERVKHKGKISLQNRRRKKLSDVLADSEIRDEVLIKLLRKEIVTLFDTHTLPILDKIYIRRRIYNVNLITADVFHTLNNSCIPMLVLNITKEMIAEKLNLSKDKIYLLKEVGDLDHVDKDVNKIFVLENLTQDAEYVRDCCKNLQSTRLLHCYKFKTEAIFQWKFSNGAKFNVEEFFLDASRKAGTQIENNFIKTVNADESIIFIADLPGMGKSYVVTKLAHELSKRFGGRLILFAEVKDLVASVQICSPENILEALKDLCCDSGCEREILKKWVNRTDSSIQIELMFDGLDEVPYSMLTDAYNILKELQKIPCIRTWVTVRDHMFNEIRIKFGTLGYRLEPFSRREQLKYLRQFWEQFCNSENLTRSWHGELKPFAEQCLNAAKHLNQARIKGKISECDIAGIPLQCRMIAEINESRIRDNTMNLPEDISYSLQNLYDQMFEKYFIEFVTKKRVLSLELDIIEMLRRCVDDMILNYAIRLLFSEKTYNSLIKSVLPEPYKNADKIAKAHGYIKSVDPIKFLHRSFAEYAISNFVYITIANKHPRILVEDSNFQKFITIYLLPNLLLHGNENNIYFLLNYMFENDKELYLKTFLKKYEDQTHRLLERMRVISIAADLKIPVGFNRCVLLTLSCIDYRAKFFLFSFVHYDSFDIVKELSGVYPELAPRHWKELSKYSKEGYSVFNWFFIGLTNFVKEFSERETSELIYKFNPFCKYLLKQVREYGVYSELILEHRDKTGLALDQFFTKLWNDLPGNVQAKHEKLHQIIIKRLPITSQNLAASLSQRSSVKPTPLDTVTKPVTAGRQMTLDNFFAKARPNK